MSARRQVDVRRVHYASKEEEEEEEELDYCDYQRYQSPSPGPRQRPGHPADSRAHRSRRSFSQEREARQADHYHYCDEEIQYNA